MKKEFDFKKIEKIILKEGNDFELGKEVRKMYWIITKKLNGK